MTAIKEAITYAESFRIEERDLATVHEFIFTKTSETASVFSCRFLKAGADEIGEEDRRILMDYMQEMAKNLKEYCEKLEVSAF